MGQRVSDFRVRISEDSVFTITSIKEPYVVLLFLSKECPFDNLYKNRIAALKNEFPQYLFLVIGNAFIPNITTLSTSKSLKYEFGIKKTPTAVVAKNNANGLSIIYKGPIDDNAQLPSKVKKDYLKEVLTHPTPQTKELYIPGCVLH